MADTEVVASKSGALAKVRTPVDESINKSDPETEKVKVSRPPSPSFAETVPIES